MTLNPDQLADAHGGNRDRQRTLVLQVTADDMQIVDRADVAAYLASDEYDRFAAEQQLSASVTSIMDRPRSRTLTLPHLFHWLRATGRAPFRGATPAPPAAATVDQLRAYQALTPEQIAPWADTIRRYVRETEGRYTDLRSGETPRLDESQPETHNTLGHLFRFPSRYPDTIGEHFVGWLRDQDQTAPDPVAPALPTSPKEAFPTIEALRAAAIEWANSTDPRLPNFREHRLGQPDRSGYWDRIMADGTPYRVSRADGYIGEIRDAWDHDDFSSDRSPYANGFWRDVRTLGFGTPAFTAQPAPAPAADLPAIPAWVRTMATWGDGRSSSERNLASIEGVDRAEIQRLLRAYADRHGGTIDGYTVGRIMANLGYHDIACPTAARWAIAHPAEAGFAGPVSAAEAAVPPGDGIIPIGPEHPGWNEWWERLYVHGAEENGYRSYYRVLADRLGGPIDPHQAVREQRARAARPVRPRIVRITLDVPVATNEEAVTPAIQQAALSLLGSGDATVVSSTLV